MACTKRIKVTWIAGKQVPRMLTRLQAFRKRSKAGEAKLLVSQRTRNI